MLVKWYEAVFEAPNLTQLSLPIQLPSYSKILGY